MVGLNKKIKGFYGGDDVVHAIYAPLIAPRSCQDIDK